MTDKEIVLEAVHPDIQAISDWALYGPKDAKIAELVRELTLTHGLRLTEIEALIFTVLSVRKTTLEAGTARETKQENPFRFSNDTPMQLWTLLAAYQNGSASEIETAVNEVAEARRMKSNGIADMVATYGDDDTS